MIEKDKQIEEMAEMIACNCLIESDTYYDYGLGCAINNIDYKKTAQNFYNAGYRIPMAKNKKEFTKTTLTPKSVVELACNVGDIIYYVKGEEILECKVSMIFQKSDKTWHYRFSYRTQFTRTPSSANLKFKMATYQEECTDLDFGHKIFTDKSEAERRLNELQ